jgi:hypothetical protein
LNSAAETLADIEAHDHAVLYSKDMPDHLVGQHIAIEITYDLRTSTLNAPSPAPAEKPVGSTAGRFSPIAARVVLSWAPVDVTTFHAVGPRDILWHGCQHRIYVTCIETIIKALEKFYVARHRRAPTRSRGTDPRLNDLLGQFADLLVGRKMLGKATSDRAIRGRSLPTK